MNATTSVDQYYGTRTRITELIESLPAAALATRVPACPLWTVHDVVSHLAGVAADYTAGNLEGAPQPPWTAVQVEARRNLPVQVILDEWAITGAALDQMILSGAAGDHPLICNPYVDSGTHEADLHGALGTGERPPEELWLTTLAWVFQDPGPTDECPGTLTIHTPEASYTLGSGAPHAEVRTTSYELFRGIFGRRSPAQIAAWNWTTPTYLWPTALSRLEQAVHPIID